MKLTADHHDVLMTLRMFGVASPSGIVRSAVRRMTVQRAFAVLDQLQTVGMVREVGRRGGQCFFELHERGWRALTKWEKHA